VHQRTEQGDGASCGPLKRATWPEGIGDGRVAVLIFIAVAFAYSIALPHVDIQGNHPVSDGSIYGMMAEHPGKIYMPGSPFVFRVLTPWTVWALPFRPQTGFALVSVLSVAGSAAILYVYARTYFDRAAALRAVTFFVLAGNVLGLLMDPWLVDGPALFLSILSFLLVRRGRLGWATVTLCLGIADHEGLLIVVAALLIAHLAENEWRFDARLVPFVALPVLVYLLIHYTPLLYGSIPPAYQAWGAENRRAVLDFRRHLDGNLVRSVIFAFATSFGGLWALAVLGFRGAPRFVRATSVMLPLLALNFLTSTDWDRVLTFAFPVVILLACRVRLRWPVLFLFLFVQAWLSGLGIDRNSGYYTEQLNHRHARLTVALLGVAVALALLGAIRSPRAPTSPERV
jgi:hypothetical protein